jgi:AbrB family looped-hinge helix DNA binding protein
MKGKEFSAMRRTAKMTSKGQVTIPVEIRRVLGVGPGDHLVFEEDKEGGGFHLGVLRVNNVFERYRGSLKIDGVRPKRDSIVEWVRDLRDE